MKNLFHLILLPAIFGYSISTSSAQDACTNIALNKPATASASTPIETPGRAVDGNLTTQWCAPDYVGWIKVDLQNKFTINKMKLVVNQAVPGKTVHEIKVSADMLNWAVAKTQSGNTVQNQVMEFVFNPALADVRGIMLNTTESTSWVAWYEIQVYAGPTKPVITKNGTLLSSSSTTNNQWYLNGTAISGATSQTYTPTAGGSYQVGVSGGVGCVSMSDVLSITTDIDDNLGKYVKVYPSPAVSNVYIEGVSSGKIELINTQGQIVKQMNVSEIKTAMDVSNLSDGVYSVRITTEEGVVVRKVLKQ